MVLLNLAFKDGRPFWDIKDVYSNGQCVYMFGSPDFAAFNATFLYLYLICIYLFKYNRSPYAIINISAITLTVLLMLNLYLESYANGVTYIYQLVIGQLCGFVYLIACLTFDDEIHKFCERAGFIVRSSRSRKFIILFYSLGSFIFIIAYYSALSLWRMPLNWIVNANNKEDFCQERFNSTGLNNLGINATFAQSGVLFVLIGAVFGQSFTINFVRSVQWSHTPVWKRLIRSVLGLALATGV